MYKTYLKNTATAAQYYNYNATKLFEQTTGAIIVL